MEVITIEIVLGAAGFIIAMLMNVIIWYFQSNKKNVREDFHHLEDKFDEVAATFESKLEGLSLMFNELIGKYSMHEVHHEYQKKIINETVKRVDILEEKVDKHLNVKKSKRK